MSYNEDTANNIEFQLQSYTISDADLSNFELIKIKNYIQFIGSDIDFQLNIYNSPSADKVNFNLDKVKRDLKPFANLILTDYVSPSSNNVDFQLSKIKKDKNEIVTKLKGSIVTTLDISSKIIPNYTIDKSNQKIYLLDNNLEIIAELDNLEYFNWTRRWRKHDSFELKINRHKDNAKKITIGKYIAVKRGDITRGGKIQHRELEVSSEGKDKEIWVFAGKSGDGIFDKRIAVDGTQKDNGYDDQTGPAESVMKHYVDVNVVNPEDSDRKFSKLEIAKDKARGPEVTFRGRFQKISEIMESLSLTSGLGWDIALDLINKKFIFKIRKGEDKSNVILSPKFDNVKLLGFRESEFESENVVYVGGQGEGAERQVIEVRK
ncbi:siphovirus ReqiPepy6 Gp37-like family protein [Sporohalobacter salinus]|uniref:siphovirus ReqiPepy6 Gp37-like family protein n=1 Tax=Sporohalobacter salinus TaxID=1494606 RepID=UPI001961F05F|nr:siphovirus ReqiPepy6 Gp37-like family protein [Sporohalobacter salinus]MBM7623711.1 hypothetical protein [Sporohalobacter salinus]